MAKIFISHSTKDKSFVKKLAIDLLVADFSVWYDDWEMDYGQSLLDKIFEGIDESTYLAIVLTENSVNSDWVKRELNAAIEKENQLKRPFIIPIIASKCQVPLKIADRIYADFSGSYMKELDKLIYRLKSKLDLKRRQVDYNKELVPIVFLNGVHLNKAFLEKRIDFIRKHAPAGFTFKNEQLVIHTDEKYDFLRNRLIERIENLKKDEWIENNQNMQNSIYQQYYWPILDFEHRLAEGIKIILNKLSFDHSIWCSCFDSCYWYAKMIRSEILARLHGSQNPNSKDISEYGRDCIAEIFANNSGVKSFYNVDKVELYYIGKRVGSHEFTIWIDKESKLVRNINYYTEDQISHDYSDSSKYIFPQMVYKALVYESPLIWDLKDYLIWEA